MDLAAQFEALQKRTSEATSAVRAATTEPREQVWQRIDQAQVDVNVALTGAKQPAGQAANRAPSKWAQLKADAAAKREDVKAKIDKRVDQLDARTATAEAESTEAAAADAIDLASWAVENARLAALDALEARAYADELAKSGS